MRETVKYKQPCVQLEKKENIKHVEQTKGTGILHYVLVSKCYNSHIQN